MQNKINVSVFILTIAAAVFLYGCDQQQSSESPGPVEKVTLGIAQESLAALAIIANKNGYFTDQGVNVTVKNYKGGKQALIDGVLAGKVDMATTADVPIVFNSFQQNDFKILATIGSSDNEPRIIARKDRLISQPQDLNGKKIVTKKGSAVHFFLNVFLVYSGLSEDDIELSFTKSGTEMAELLASGKIDAFSHREPFIGKAKKLLGDNAIIFEKPGAYTKTFNLVAANNVLDQKPEAIKRVLKALLMAEEFVGKHPGKATALVADFIGSAESDLFNIWKTIDLKVALDRTLITTLEAQARWAMSSHLVDAAKVPNYLQRIAPNYLKAVKPEAVSLDEVSAN